VIEYAQKKDMKCVAAIPFPTVRYQTGSKTK